MATSAPHIKVKEKKVRVLIADDQPPIRKAVRLILEEDPRFEVCGEAADGAKAIEEAQRLNPDVVILNVSMPVLNGLAAAREINAALPELAIIILSSNADRHFVEAAKEAGARAYVAKTKAGVTLIRAVEAAMTSGDFVLVE